MHPQKAKPYLMADITALNLMIRIGKADRLKLGEARTRLSLYNRILSAYIAEILKKRGYHMFHIITQFQ